MPRTLLRQDRSLNVHKKKALVLGFIALLWINMPYLVGWLVSNSSDDCSFGGFFIFEQDGFSYLAKMRQGAKGNWLFHLPYTTEPHQGALLYVFYLTVGKAARLVGIPLINAYHITRLLGSGLLLAAGARFITHFATSRWRLLSWGLLLLGGDAGWLVTLFNPRYIAYASVTPDAFLYSVLFGPPHIIIALAILLWLLQKVLQQIESPAQNIRWNIWLLLMPGGLLMALARPEYVAVLLSVLGAYWLALLLTRRKFPIREALLFSGTAFPGTIYALYVFYISKANPVIAAWTTQNPFYTPPLVNLLAGIGPLLLPGLLGVISGRWWQDEKRLLLVAWAVALPIMLYLPLSLNRRLVGGAHFALTLPAGYWLDKQLLPWLQGAQWRRVIVGPLTALAALILISYPLLFSLGAAGFVASRPDQLFLSANERDALAWLAEHGEGAIILSAEQTGNHIPAFSNATPVLGHPIETLSVEQKRADVARFYTTDASPAERQATLAHYGVNYVWFGPAERALGSFDPAGVDGIQLVFQQEQEQIWATGIPISTGDARDR